MNAFTALFAGITCLHLIAAPASAGGIYKWVDQHGVTHYADRPSKQHPSARLGHKTLPPISISQPPAQIPWAKQTPKARSRQGTRQSKPDCDRFRTEIRKIEATLRAGYVEPTGSRLRERKRQWTTRLQRQCY